MALAGRPGLLEPDAAKKTKKSGGAVCKGFAGNADNDEED
jgi:hypothetical protein